jgi:heptosyltransferase-2
MGDVVLTTPVIRCIQQQVPNAELHYLTKDIFAEIVSANPYVSKTYSLKKEVMEVVPALLEEQYDLIIDLHNNIRSRQVSSLLKVKTFRYNKQSFKRFLLTQFKLDLLNNHIVDRYFTAVKQLNVINDGKGLDYFIPEAEEIPTQNLPFTHLAGFVAIVVGAKHFTKRIPKEKLEALCAGIAMPIMLIGGVEDAYLGTQLEAIDKFKIYNGCGKFSIHQSASLIKKAKAVITPDTGMMHIAAAFNKRIISIWGGTDKRLGFAPYPSNSSSVIIENVQIACRPCHRFGRETCPKGHFKCMKELDMQKVLDIL